MTNPEIYAIMLSVSCMQPKGADSDLLLIFEVMLDIANFYI